MWQLCDRSARITVSVLRPGAGLGLHGTFCVPHAALSARALRADVTVEVWLDWVRSVHDAPAGRDVGRDDEIRQPGATRTAGRRGDRGPHGGPRWRGRGGPADPFELAT
ncbi:MAG TPA: hypothetical protein VK891_14645 [Euzebyales bacterium]|nr:hypothetical protein [Euzebyales bacterium]